MRGFSLVEMLVVLVIASLMLLLIPPLFSGSAARLNMKSQVEQVYSSLLRARSQAIATSTPVAWIMDVAQGSYQVGERGKTKYLDSNTQVSFTTARSEILTEGDASAIRFYPDGGATGGQIILQNDTQRYVVQVDWLTGQVNVQ